MKIKLAIITLILIFSAATHAASFDCGKAKTSIEKMICKDESLSTLDDLLNKAYKKELSYRGTLPELQLLWLTNIRNQCKNVECLQSAYKSRIENISDIASYDCHDQTVCFWDYIKEQKIIKEVNNNKLIKFTVIRILETHNDQSHILESKGKDIYKSFAFCAKKMPVLINCDTKICDVDFLDFFK